MALTYQNRNHFMKNILTLLVTMVLFATGCAEFHNGDEASDSLTTPRFVFGELRYTEITPIEHAWIGLQTALQDLHYTVKSTDHDLLQAELVALGEGKQIKIHLTENSPTTTEIRIRAGTFGDKALARRVLTALRKRI
jgi:hypothetical protein